MPLCWFSSGPQNFTNLSFPPAQTFQHRGSRSAMVMAGPQRCLHSHKHTCLSSRPSKDQTHPWWAHANIHVDTRSKPEHVRARSFQPTGSLQLIALIHTRVLLLVTSVQPLCGQTGHSARTCRTSPLAQSLFKMSL